MYKLLQLVGLPGLAGYIERVRYAATCSTFCSNFRWLVLKDSYLVMLKPSKLKEEKALPASRPEGGDERGSQMTLHTLIADGEGEDAHMTHHQPKGTHGGYHRNRRWRYCKVILMDRFFNYSTHNSGAGSVLHIGNMHV